MLKNKEFVKFNILKTFEFTLGIQIVQNVSGYIYLPPWSMVCPTIADSNMLEKQATKTCPELNYQPD